MVRLRQFYQQNGFPKAEVDYTIQLDSLNNLVDITLDIDEGPPLIIRNLNFLGPDGQPLLHVIWHMFADPVLSKQERVGLKSNIYPWFSAIYSLQAP